MSLVSTAFANIAQNNVLSASSVTAANMSVGDAVFNGAFTALDFLNVQGNVTVDGSLTANTFVGGVQLITGDGAVSVAHLTTAVTTSGTGQDDLTLAAGANGQLKYIVYAVDTTPGDTIVITPAGGVLGVSGTATITLGAEGAAVMLVYLTTVNQWAVLSAYGTVTIA